LLLAWSSTELSGCIEVGEGFPCGRLGGLGSLLLLITFDVKFDLRSFVAGDRKPTGSAGMEGTDAGDPAGN
jgi:hypothetical protein